MLFMNITLLRFGSNLQYLYPLFSIIGWLSYADCWYRRSKLYSFQTLFRRRQNPTNP